MISRSTDSLGRLFRFVIARRWWVVAVYALLLVPSVYFAIHVGQDDSVERLMVRNDPDFLATQEFSKVFGSGESVILLAEARDPFAPAVLRQVDLMERRLEGLRGVEANSVISIYRRNHPDFEATPPQCEAFRRFATGTSLFRRQGLLGPNFLSVILGLDYHDPEGRHALLDAIDQTIDAARLDPSPLTALRKVGQAYVNAYFEDATASSAKRLFPLFALFVVGLILRLYRSFRALWAFVLTMLTSLILTVGYAGVSGDVITIVSSLVPMTVLVTCTATLVYIHSRFVEQPGDRSVDEHLVFTLSNKFLPCTASLFATAVGFASLSVSSIRPIREMGIWVAVGVLITWIVVFTLFPALQRILNTPTQRERRIAGRWFGRLVAWLPRFTYRWRFVLVPLSLVLCALGAIALFGLPGLVSPMRLQTDATDYIDPETPLAQDARRIQQLLPSQSATEIWLQGPSGSLLGPAVMNGLESYARSVERDERVGSVVGVTTVLRLVRYLAGEGDRLPDDAIGMKEISDELENMLLQEPSLRSFVDVSTLGQTHITVLSRAADFREYLELDKTLTKKWQDAVARSPALEPFTMRIVGTERLQAKIAYHLVPTLVESFLLTAAIIFVTFLLLFRNTAARLMAMIPSLFAILVTFAFMRVFDFGLNVATILIASTVLGTSENDQIHFFYHFLEGRRNGSVEEGMRHALLIAGRAIVFATLINAGGFLAFALSDLPPMRQLGILSALAFVLSMLADFTALPAALWIISGGKPDGRGATD